MRISRLLPLALSLAAISACTRTPALPPLPRGVQELHGIVQPAELKLVRRGTHVLMQAGRPTYFLESAEVDLHDYENHEVTVRGRFEQNTDPTAAPVMIVQEVVQDELSTRTWTLPTLDVAFDVPKNWQGTLTGDHATFTASGSLAVVLNVTASSLLDAPFQALGSGADGGMQAIPIVIAGKRALRVIDEKTGRETVALDLGPSATDPSRRVITFAFEPPANLTAEESREVMLQLIQSITLGSSSQSSVSSRSRSGSGSSLGTEGAPCGGTAGVLCPAGYFCDVTDLEANVGRCRKL